MSGAAAIKSITTVRHLLSGMTVEIFPALKDNYMYLIINAKSLQAAIVDPVEPDELVKRIKNLSLKLTTVLTTHHHWDHSSGNLKIKELFPDIKIYGGDERIDGLTDNVSHGDTLQIDDINISCLSTPCHTRGHICYYIGGEEPAVFTGDTLFLGGCGRFFEGTAPQMYKNLVETLGSLPEKTKVYCGHEYALNNLQFGRHVEPNNEVLLEKYTWAQSQRSGQSPKPTVPSTIGEEKEINPFMRVKQPSVQKHTNTMDPHETMKVLRAEKDNFKSEI